MFFIHLFRRYFSVIADIRDVFISSPLLFVSTLYIYIYNSISVHTIKTSIYRLIINRYWNEFIVREIQGILQIIRNIRTVCK